MIPLSQNRDVNIDILNRLDDESLVKICQLSEDADEICMREDFWKRRVFTKFSYIPIEILREGKGDQNWSSYYINDLIKVHPSHVIGYAGDGRLDLVMIAVDQGANVHEYHELALGLASGEGHLEVVKYLVSQGADIHALGDSAIRNAIESGHLEVVKYLVGIGADVDFDELYYNIKIARKRGHSDVVEYIQSVL